MASEQKPDEKEIMIIKPSWRAYIEYILAGIFLVYFGGWSLLLLVWVLYRIKSQKYALTNRRIVYESGLWRKNQEDVSLARIGDITVWQGSAQKMLGIGNINITLANEKAPVMTIRGVESPNELAAELRKRVRKPPPKKA